MEINIIKNKMNNNSINNNNNNKELFNKFYNACNDGEFKY
jgi:hypothetical protein